MAHRSRLYLLPVLLVAVLCTPQGGFADETLKTFPPGSASDVLKNPAQPNHPKDPKNDSGTLIIENDCAKQTARGKELPSGSKNPEYEACVRAKIEQSKHKKAP